MFYGLFCSKFFTDHFYEVHFGPSGPTYAKKYQKLPKIRQKSLWLDLNFLETWTEIEKLFFKSPCFMAYFVPNFVLIIFLQSILVHQVPPTQKIAKTAENSAKIALLGTRISRNWDRNRKNGSNGVNCISF